MAQCVQVCVSECPTANEFGVRSNPVCVDGVDTTPFINITSVDFTNVVSSSGNVAVSCSPFSLFVYLLLNPDSVGTDQD